MSVILSILRDVLSRCEAQMEVSMTIDAGKIVSLFAQKGKNLDTWCYRGFAPINELALISQADVYDQEQNANGLQRDLSPKHASDAYEYVRGGPRPEHPRAFPEVVLNVRDKRVLKLEEVLIPEKLVPPPNASIRDAAEQGQLKLFRLDFHTELMDRPSPMVFVSRVDGNHRLQYANGDSRLREPLDAVIPFQIHVGLTVDQERSLFVDINSNQKGLNSSHLGMMQSKLTPEQEEIKFNLGRWIANKMVQDPDSPWHGLVHLGGSKKGSRVQGLTRVVNFASLQTGVKKTLTKSQYIHDLTDANAQYVILRNYWHAVKRTYSQEWAGPKEYLLMKNIGVQSLSILGGTIIDRCMLRGKVEIGEMVYYLQQTVGTFDWHGKAVGDTSLRGMTGNQAATIVAASMATELSDTSGMSLTKEIQDSLLGRVSG